MACRPPLGLAHPGGDGGSLMDPPDPRGKSATVQGASKQAAIMGAAFLPLAHYAGYPAESD
jgi:hypothetical protein